jgi:hypothetical protein
MPEDRHAARAASEDAQDTISLAGLLAGSGLSYSSVGPVLLRNAGTVTLALLLLCAAGCATTAERDTGSAELHEHWGLVARSHIIATGTMRVPVEQIRSHLASGQHEYVELKIKRDKVLKGTVSGEFAVRWFTRPRFYSPLPEDVIASDDKKVLVFLTQVDNRGISIAGSSGFERPGITELFFAGSTPQALRHLDACLVRQIKQEVATQERILAQFDNEFPPAEEALYEEVKGLIDATTREERQKRAYRELEALGAKAVPAIIMLMDDRRDLAVPSISLRNSPGHWEATRHYSPKKVVDAMAAILNQITGNSFGTIHNGGTERERTECVRGWRVYLYYLKDKSLESL